MAEGARPPRRKGTEGPPERRQCPCGGKKARKLRAFGGVRGFRALIACGGEGRKLIFDDVVVRVNTDGATTMHIDTDEAQAAGGPTEGEIFRV